MRIVETDCPHSIRFEFPEWSFKFTDMPKPLLSIVLTGHGDGVGTSSFIQSLGDQRRYTAAPHSRDPKISCPFAKVTEFRAKELPLIELILTWDGKCPYTEDQGEDSKLITKVIENQQQGAPGHHTRGPGIEAATGSWIYLTNCDNVLVHGWLHYVLDAMETSVVAGITWDCVNNLWGWTTLGGSKIERGKIDLSCAMFRSEYVKQVGFPYKDYDGDFDYIKACTDLVLKDRKAIRQFDAILSIHN